MTDVEEVNKALRAAVEERLAATPPEEQRCVPCEIRRAAHPSSNEFFALCDALKEMHRKKSHDYGSSSDPLANIRNGAEFVGISPWRAAMVRLSDKVTRLATFNRTGTLLHEGVEDTLLDLASYSLLTLVLFRQENSK